MRTLTIRAAAIDCCTPQLVRRNLEAFGDAYGGKFRVIDNATNLERFRPATKSECRRDVGLPQDAMILGYVGGTPWERGGAQIVDAVARLGEEFPRLCGVIVGGTTGGLEALRSRARERKVADRCTMVPRVPYDDVPTWINALDIGVALDLAERLEYVGSSNQKIRQYLACGKPVIAGAGSTGTNDFIAEHDLGGTVGPGDSTGFDALVRDLLQQTPDLRQAFAMRARRYAEEHLSVDVALEARIAWWRERGVSLNGHGGEHAP